MKSFLIAVPAFIFGVACGVVVMVYIGGSRTLDEREDKPAVQRAAVADADDTSETDAAAKAKLERKRQEAIQPAQQPVPGKLGEYPIPAFEIAKSTGVPVFAIVGQYQCLYCARLKKSIYASTMFTKWLQERKYMAVYADAKTGGSFIAMKEFKKRHPEFAKIRVGAPIVYAKWNRADGTEVVKAFSARHGEMGVTADKSLATELMAAIDALFKGWEPPLDTPNTQP